jgi:hypothetical protein
MLAAVSVRASTPFSNAAERITDIPQPCANVPQRPGIARARVQAPAAIVIGETVRLRPVLDWVDASALFPSLQT